MEYYLRFIERFPDVATLAAASEQEVLTYWQGLGYYSRARNLHSAANQVVELQGGKFPTQYDQVRALKGIGDYTAAAICSIAFELPYAVVDGNVYRVLSRLYGIDTPIDSTVGKKEFQELAQQLIDHSQPGLHNQAMMEFGALACVPVNPDCESCPLKTTCKAYEQELVDVLPVKSKKTLVRELYYTYLVIRNQQQILIRQRSTATNIWKNMYEFPLVESSHLLTPQEVLTQPFLGELGELTLNPLYTDTTHILSHRKINVRFYEIEVLRFRTDIENCVVTTLEALQQYPVPRLISRYLEV
jgi:A/G-specific adenine glycosylase